MRVWDCEDRSMGLWGWDYGTVRIGCVAGRVDV